MNYGVSQDHLTKFCVLRAPVTERAHGAEVDFQLANSFLLLGAPAIPHSDKGSQFTSHVITELKEAWPELKLVHGEPRRPQSLDSANSGIKDNVSGLAS